VHALLGHLHAAGFGGAPRPLGLDEFGREVLTFIPGTIAWPDTLALLDPDDLRSGGFSADEVIGAWKAAMSDVMYSAQFDLVRACRCGRGATSCPAWPNSCCLSPR
jgi:hypothetical protein